MSILIGLIPALAWGIAPLLLTRIGGTPSNQILGTTAGAFLVALVLTLISPSHDSTSQVFIISLLSGALWVIGQIGLYTAFQMVGVSRTMPLAAGLQLLGTTLIGVFVFHEWNSGVEELIGFAALALVILGIYLTNLKKGARTAFNGRVFLLLFLTNFGFLAYTAIPRVLGTSGMAILFPQMMGMLLATIIYALATRQGRIFRERTSWLNMLTGSLFALASLTYILSAESNGIATAFVLGQLGVVISTLGGIVLLKERKTRFELIAICIGLAFVVIGGGVTAMLK